MMIDYEFWFYLLFFIVLIFGKEKKKLIFFIFRFICLKYLVLENYKCIKF